MDDIYLVLSLIPSLYMKKRILFLLTLYFMWLPLLAIQKPVFMLYHHALASGCSLIDYLKVITHGLLLDCTIAGYLTALPLLMTLVSVWLPGVLLQEATERIFRNHGYIDRGDLSPWMWLYTATGDSGWMRRFSSIFNHPVMRWQAYRWDSSSPSY